MDNGPMCGTRSGHYAQGMAEERKRFFLSLKRKSVGSTDVVDPRAGATHPPKEVSSSSKNERGRFLAMVAAKRASTDIQMPETTPEPASDLVGVVEFTLASLHNFLTRNIISGGGKAAETAGIRKRPNYDNRLRRLNMNSRTICSKLGRLVRFRLYLFVGFVPQKGGGEQFFNANIVSKTC